ncbi:MAG: peptidase M28, partial [Actinobacteria bacterium]|nr:peptidase M28 [Actinomycetota bacterium]
MRHFVGVLVLLAANPVAAQSSVDTSGVGRLIDQAVHHSEVMQNLEYLTDRIGPRLSSSPAMRRANEWTAERFKAYGLTARLEVYHFGVLWERGSASLRLIAPFTRALTAESWAWTEGTGGKNLN